MGEEGGEGGWRARERGLLNVAPVYCMGTLSVLTVLAGTVNKF